MLAQRSAAVPGQGRLSRRETSLKPSAPCAPSAPFAPFPGLVAVGLVRVDQCALEDEAISARLTGREHAALRNRMRPERRRASSLARIVSKHLLLDALEHVEGDGGSGGSGGSWDRRGSPVRQRSPSLQVLDALALGELSVRACQSVEVLSARGVAPRLGADGEALEHTSLSLTHDARWAGAAIGTAGRGPVGVDVEVATDHPAPFFEDYFTPRERRWVAEAGDSARLALFTLLWTMKESMLKMGVAPDPSLLTLGLLEVVVDTPGDQVAAHCLADSGGGSTVCPLALRVHVGAAELRPSAFYARCGESIVSLAVHD